MRTTEHFSQTEQLGELVVAVIMSGMIKPDIISLYYTEDKFMQIKYALEREALDFIRDKNYEPDNGIGVQVEGQRFNIIKI
jgi:hypothetical protein